MVPEIVPRSDCARPTLAQLSDMIAMTTRKLLKNIRCSPYKARLNSVADNLSFPELGCKGADRGLTCDGIEVVGPVLCGLGLAADLRLDALRSSLIGMRGKPQESSHL